MAITAVGSLAGSTGAANATLSVSPTAVGDMLVLYVKTTSATITALSVSGGGCSTWVRLAGPTLDGSGTTNHSMFLGTATATGAATATVAFSASVAGVNSVIDSQQFTSPYGRASLWQPDVSGFLSNGSSTTVTYPTLVPTGSAELYFGHSRMGGTPAAGATSGFTYVTDIDGDAVCYNGNVSASVAPTQTQSPANTSFSQAGIVAVRAKAAAMVGTEAVRRAANW